MKSSKMSKWGMHQKCLGTTNLQRVFRSGAVTYFEFKLRKIVFVDL